MATPPPRLIVIDDADSTITYTGPWFEAAANSLDNLGNYGPTYLGTSHGTNGSGSLSYSFQGSAVNVFGTTNISNSSGIVDPSWECFIDSISIGATAPFQDPKNNWLLCTWDNNGTSGSHVLTLKANSTGHTFWFDWLQYEPAPSTSLYNAVVYLDHQDAAIKYDSSWQAQGSTANMTTKEGSTVTLDFIGTRLSWYGFIPTELPHNASLATYAIDGQILPTNFTLKGLITANSTTIYHQQLFQTPVLSSSTPHELVVTFHGNVSSTPLTISYVLIQNGSLPVSAPFTASPSAAATISTASLSLAFTGIASPSPYHSPHSQTTPFSLSSSHHGSPGPIIGVLGGLSLFFSIIGFVCLKYLRLSSPEGKIARAPRQSPRWSVPSPRQNNGHSPDNNIPGTPASQSSFQLSDHQNSREASSSGPSSLVPITRLGDIQLQPLLPTLKNQMDTMEMSLSADSPVCGSHREATSGSRSRAVLDQDSGIQVLRQREDGVVALPLFYTPEGKVLESANPTVTRT